MPETAEQIAYRITHELPKGALEAFRAKSLELFDGKRADTVVGLAIQDAILPLSMDERREAIGEKEAAPVPDTALYHKLHPLLMSLIRTGSR